MTTIRFLRRLLGITTIAAAGVAPESEARAADFDGRAEESADLDATRLESLVDRLGPTDPALAAMLVGTALCMAHPLERIALMSEWATATSVIRRRALARALSHPFTGAGLATAIDALAQDPDPVVRTAATQAALLRLGHDPDRYAAILERAERRGR